MDDLISRQAAIDAVRRLQTYKLSEGDDMLLVDKAEVQTELMMLPSAQQWIPVTEQLPEGKEKHWEDGEYPDTYYESDPVLVWARYTGYKVDEFFGIGTCYMSSPSSDAFDWDGTGFGDYDLSHQFIKVLAWMPLPAPWKGGET